MKISIQPSAVTGTVSAPSSKSSMQRACAAALLSRGITTILNPGVSNDDVAALDVIVKLGAKIIRHSKEEIVIESNGIDPADTEINCGESGLGIRMFTPLAALSDRELVINGTGSLLNRPMHFFDEIFPKLDIRIKSNNGRLPITVKGPLRPVDIEIDGSLSSQFLTGLLMAYAAAAASGVSITVKNLKSRPYIDLTLDVMKHFGISVQNDNYEKFTFVSPELPLPSGGGLSPEDFLVPSAIFEKAFVPATYTVEGDWSGGAFLLVAGAIAGKITVKGLTILSAQADREIMKALNDSGAQIDISENEITVAPAVLKAFSFDATDCPDLFPPLVALAAYCNGITVIGGVSRLAHKESNRGLTLQEEFAKMGVKIELEDDLMKVHGGKALKGAVVHSRHDHRIAMACAIAALGAEGETAIEEAEAVNKSFPDFYEKLEFISRKGAKEAQCDKEIS
ncbi:MAG: 3-phosphoshikimate 1-carboxyvinyltransferase [Chitinophagaceae bacterium]|nr:3-phosphoshikimate 1-carboxyvinyltransferase [Chitinophagaceae bacterium]